MLKAALIVGGAAVLATGWAAAGVASAQSRLEIRDAVATVVVIPEDRSDVVVTVNQPASRLPRLMQRVEGDRLILDGHIGRQTNCRSRRGGPAEISGDWGSVTLDQAPRITARVPRNAVVGAGPAVWGEVGRAESTDLSVYGCGDWMVAHVNGRLEVNVAGSGSVRTGNAARAEVNIGGSGDVRMRAISGPVTANIGGSGSVRAEAVDGGPVRARVGGSGDVTVESGRTSELRAEIGGSGTVSFNGRADRVNATIAGSGDVHVQSAGSVSRTVVGSGNVTVGSD